MTLRFKNILKIIAIIRLKNNNKNHPNPRNNLTISPIALIFNNQINYKKKMLNYRIKT